MAIKQELIYKLNDESVETFPNFSDWVETLPVNEREEVQRALASITTIENALVNAGKLVVEFLPAKTYTWTDEEVVCIIPHSPNWKKYHARYLEENNITLEVKTTTL